MVHSEYISCVQNQKITRHASCSWTWTYSLPAEVKSVDVWWETPIDTVKVIKVLGLFRGGGGEWLIKSNNRQLSMRFDQT